MESKINEIKIEIDQFEINSNEQLENFRIKFLGSKGITKELFSELKNVPNEQKKDLGQLLNKLRTQAEEKFEYSKKTFSANKTVSDE